MSITSKSEPSLSFRVDKRVLPMSPEVLEKLEWKTVSELVSDFEMKSRMTVEWEALVPCYPEVFRLFPKTPVWYSFRDKPMEYSKFVHEKRNVILQIRVGGSLEVFEPKSESFFATLLRIPPANYLGEFVEGGEITYSETEPILPSTFKTWTEISIPAGVTFNIAPVTRGTLYVFRSEAHITDLGMEYVRVSEDVSPPTEDRRKDAIVDEEALCGETCAEIERERATVLKALAVREEAANKRKEIAIASIVKGEYPPSITNLLEELYPGQTIVLQRRYPEGVRAVDLMGTDYLLYCALKEKGYKIHIQHKRFMATFGEIPVEELNEEYPEYGKVIDRVPFGKSVESLSLRDDYDLLVVHTDAFVLQYDSKRPHPGDGQILDDWSRRVATPVWDSTVTVFTLARSSS
jgi:hypothetical protein